MHRITIKDPRDNKYYYYNASPRWYNKHDNGAMISCGLTVGEKSGYSGKEYLSAGTFDRMKKAKTGLREISKETYDHSGCQSSCTLRGGKECRW